MRRSAARAHQLSAGQEEGRRERSRRGAAAGGRAVRRQGRTRDRDQVDDLSRAARRERPRRRGAARAGAAAWAAGVPLCAEPLGVGRRLPRRAQGRRGRQPGERHAHPDGTGVRAPRLRGRRGVHQCRAGGGRGRGDARAERPGHRRRFRSGTDGRGALRGPPRRGRARARPRRRPGVREHDRLHLGNDGTPQGGGAEPPRGAAQLRPHRDDARPHRATTSWSPRFRLRTCTATS